MATSKPGLIQSIVEANVRTAQQRSHANWGKYLYHQAPLAHAVSILNGEMLLSRDLAKQQRLISADAASTEVIAQSGRCSRFARLYFRPMTPTHYHWEGVKHPDHLRQAFSEAHCPVPITFRFDALNVLSIDDMHFTLANAARSSEPIRTDPTFLESADWDRIYHSQALPADPDVKRDIVGSRQAEVLIPDRLSTSYLNSIVARSPAERDTFLAMLGEQTRQLWMQQVVVESGNDRCYHKHRCFVSTVSRLDDRILIQFAGSSAYLSHEVSVRIQPFKGTWLPRQTLHHSLRSALTVPFIGDAGPVRVQVKIFGHLASDVWVSNRLVW